jgi:heterotetrameric sarcosine oxidase gamma subunit
VIEPLRQSALHPCHRDAGAHLQTFSGWQLPAWYAQEPAQELAHVRQSVGVSDASYLTKLDLRGQANELPVALPARLWMLTPRHALITAPQPIAFAPSTSVTDVTSLYSAILLAGPASRQVLQKLTTLNLRPEAMADGAARQARLAHVNATFLRLDHDGVPAFLILSTRDVAEHLWQTLLHAGSAFGAQPFGVLAQQKWLGPA